MFNWNKLLLVGIFGWYAVKNFENLDHTDLVINLILTRLNLMLVIQWFNNKHFFKVKKKLRVFLKCTIERLVNFINIFCFFINCDISPTEGERKLYISGWLLSFGAGNFERENLSGQIWPLCSVSVNTFYFLGEDSFQKFVFR